MTSREVVNSAGSNFQIRGRPYLSGALEGFSITLYPIDGTVLKNKYEIDVIFTNFQQN